MGTMVNCNSMGIVQLKKTEAVMLNLSRNDSGILSVLQIMGKA